MTPAEKKLLEAVAARDPVSGERITYEQALERAAERYGKTFRSLTHAPRLEPPSRDLVELQRAATPLVIVESGRK